MNKVHEPSSLFLYIFLGLVVSLIHAVFSASLARKRGYEESAPYFILGLFFWILGFLYVMGLPVIVRQPLSKKVGTEPLIQSSASPPDGAQPTAAPAPDNEAQTISRMPGPAMAGQSTQSVTIASLRAAYRANNMAEFNQTARSLLSSGYNESLLRDSCIDAKMRSWLESAIREV